MRSDKQLYLCRSGLGLGPSSWARSTYSGFVGNDAIFRVQGSGLVGNKGILYIGTPVRV